MSITSILNSRNADYQQWIDEQLQVLGNIDRYSSQGFCTFNYYDCLNLQNVIGTGGSAKVILAKFRQGPKCETLFNVSSKYTFAVKLCYSEDLGQLACRELYAEIIAALQYSKLYAGKICNNFLYCIGYGLNCCLLVGAHELDLPPSELRNYQILKRLGYDIEDYLSMQREEGCDTFLLVNNVSGPDLAKAISTNPDFELTARQTFEVVYSLLCSVLHFGAIPGDRHLDNYMLDKTGKRMVVTIGEVSLFFKTTTSLVNIDYQVMTARDRLLFSDIAIVYPFMHRDLKVAIKKLFTADLAAMEMLLGLVDVFSEYHCTDCSRINGDTTVFLTFKRT